MLGRKFWELTPKAQLIKEKIDEVDFVKIKKEKLCEGQREWKDKMQTRWEYLHIFQRTNI